MQGQTLDSSIIYVLAEHGWTLTIRAVDAVKTSGITVTANGTEWKDRLYVHYMCVVEVEKQGVRLIGKCKYGTTYGDAVNIALADAYEQVELLAKRAITRVNP